MFATQHFTTDVLLNQGLIKDIRQCRAQRVKDTGRKVKDAYSQSKKSRVRDHLSYTSQISNTEVPIDRPHTE